MNNPALLPPAGSKYINIPPDDASTTAQRSALRGGQKGRYIAPAEVQSLSQNDRSFPLGRIMDMLWLHVPLNELIKRYRKIPFDTWNSMHAESSEFHDYESDDVDSQHWWQAHTSVLEIVEEESGRNYALIGLTIYPRGVHSSPPAPASAICVYDDGSVFGRWADESEFLLPAQRA